MIGRMPSRTAILATLLALVSAVPAVFAQSAVTRPQPRENISVRADLAWEDRDTDAVHVQGHVAMRSTHWALGADTAVLQGALDAPLRVQAEGNPARMQFEDEDGEGPRHVDARAERVEYQREGGRIALSGKAELRRDTDLMQGERIEYWRDTDRFSAGGEGRVRLVIRPGAKRSAPGPR